MYEICIGRMEGEDKYKRKNRKEEERTKKSYEKNKRVKVVTHFIK